MKGKHSTNINVTLPNEIFNDLDGRAIDIGIPTATFIRLIVVHAYRNNIEVEVTSDIPKRRNS